MFRALLSTFALLVSVALAAASGPSAGLIKLPSGVSLHYAVQGRPDGEPVVLLHGVGDSWRSFDLILPHIPDRYRVYAVSQRGHGWSDAPASGYSQADLAADATAFLEALDLRNVTIVGHSMGSFVAQAVAARDAGRLKSLVLVGSGPGGAKRVEAEVRGAFEAMRQNPRFARDFQASMSHQPVPAAFLEMMIEACAGVPAHAWAQLGAVTHSADTEAGLAAIKVPTLLVWGDRDALLNREDQDVLLKKIKGSRLLVYPETGHVPHWEHPERFAKDLLAFLAS
jgi:non-heme chloroperoxidase